MLSELSIILKYLWASDLCGIGYIQICFVPQCLKKSQQKVENDAISSMSNTTCFIVYVY